MTKFAGFQGFWRREGGTLERGTMVCEIDARGNLRDTMIGDIVPVEDAGDLLGWGRDDGPAKSIGPTFVCSVAAYEHGLRHAGDPL